MRYDREELERRGWKPYGHPDEMMFPPIDYPPSFPALTPAEAASIERYVDAKVREALEKAEQVVEDWPCPSHDLHVMNVGICKAIRALKPEES